MRPSCLAFSVLILLGACQSSTKPLVSTPPWNVLASTPTPELFSLGQPWSFVETNNGRIVRSFTIVFTDQPAPTCIGGQWLSAKVEPRPSVHIGKTAAFSLRDGAPQPAYLLEGSALWINLSSGICDWGDDFVGQLTADGFVGYAREQGLLHYEQKGIVYGTPVHAATDT